MRAQYPAHTMPFVNDFKEVQMKLLASYHGIYDDDDFNRSRGQIAKPRSFMKEPRCLLKRVAWALQISP